MTFPNGVEVRQPLCTSLPSFKGNSWSCEDPLEQERQLCLTSKCSTLFTAKFRQVSEVELKLDLKLNIGDGSRMETLGFFQDCHRRHLKFVCVCADLSVSGGVCHFRGTVLFREPMHAMGWEEVARVLKTEVEDLLGLEAPFGEFLQLQLVNKAPVTLKNLLGETKDFKIVITEEGRKIMNLAEFQMLSMSREVRDCIRIESSGHSSVEEVKELKTCKAEDRQSGLGFQRWSGEVNSEAHKHSSENKAFKFSPVSANVRLDITALVAQPNWGKKVKITQQVGPRIKHNTKFWVRLPPEGQLANTSTKETVLVEEDTSVQAEIPGEEVKAMTGSPEDEEKGEEVAPWVPRKRRGRRVGVVLGWTGRAEKHKLQRSGGTLDRRGRSLKGSKMGRGRGALLGKCPKNMPKKGLCFYCRVEKPSTQWRHSVTNRANQVCNACGLSEKAGKLTQRLEKLAELAKRSTGGGNGAE